MPMMLPADVPVEFPRWYPLPRWQRWGHVTENYRRRDGATEQACPRVPRVGSRVPSHRARVASRTVERSSPTAGIRE
jgi:hypothetical protein